MPAKNGRYEQHLIELFVSSYQNYAWADARIERLDENHDGAVEALITRADGRTMAIEHTLIEPFEGDKSDYATFQPAFLQIENDKGLAIPNTGITVFVPVGVLKGQRIANRSVIIESIHSWMTRNRLQLREGEHQYRCDIPEMPSITLTVRLTKFRRPESHPGSFLVRRQQVKNDLDKVVEKALRKKLPKLVNTPADHHVLLLERDQFTFNPDLIFDEIESQRPNFRLLEEVDEIWHVETIFYKQSGHVYFELRKSKTQELHSSFIAPHIHE